MTVLILADIFVFPRYKMLCSSLTHRVTKNDILSVVHLVLPGTVDVIAPADVVGSKSQWRQVFGVKHQLHGGRTYSAWHFYDRLWNRHQLSPNLFPCWVQDYIRSTRHRNTHITGY
jgi:hypothetical protein